jgi:hypothetical protein
MLLYVYFTTEKFWAELIAYFSLMRQWPHIKRKNVGELTHRQQTDFISLITKLTGNTQIDGQTDGYSDRQKGVFISLLLFFSK